MTEKLPIGTRIVFLKALSQGPTGDTPAFLFARKGEGGVVTGHNDFEGHSVKWDGWPSASFGAELGTEFQEEKV
jgi:hypothetical protein